MTTKRAFFQSRRRAAVGFAAILLGATSVLTGAGAFAGASAKVAEPISYTDNPKCADFGFSIEFKIDKQPTAGTYEVGGSSVETAGSVPAGTTITISNVESPGGRLEFDWSSNQYWDAVLVKQSNEGLRYVYNPSANNDQNVQTVSGQNQGGISHVSFCGPATNVPTTTTTTEAEETTTTTEAEETTTTTEAEETTTTTEAEETTTTTEAEETTTTTEAEETTTTTEASTTTTEASTTTSETVLGTVVTNPTSSSSTSSTEATDTTRKTAIAPSSSVTVAGVQIARAPLPRTGASSLPLTEAGAVLVLLGVAFLGSSRLKGLR